MKLRKLVSHKIEELDGWKDLGKSLAAVSDESNIIRIVVASEKFSSGVCHCEGYTRIPRSKVVIAVVAGMTEDQPASASLLRSAERYRSLFEAVPDLVFTKDRNLRFSEINPAMEKVLGLSASEIVGRTSEQVYGKEAGERIRAWDFRVLSGEMIEEEHTVPGEGREANFPRGSRADQE